MKTRAVFALLVVAIAVTGLFYSARAKAAGVEIKKGEASLKLALFLQGWTTLEPNKAPSGKSIDLDLFLRRARLLFIGKLNDVVQFFVETGSPNFGKHGNLDVDMFIQDAWAEFDIKDWLIVNAGMLLVPFSHHGMQGAFTLHGLDQHIDLIKYPRGSTRVWRDFGVMIRGLLLNRLLEYRVALLNGVHGDSSIENVTLDRMTWSQIKDPRNPHDWPRLTFRLALNIFDADGDAGAGGFFYDGIYLKQTDQGIISPSKVLSFGFSADWQRDLNVTWKQAQAGKIREIGSRTDYFAVAGDLFFDMPVDNEGLVGLCGQVNMYYYDHGSRSKTSAINSFYAGDSGLYTGVGLFTEAGIRYDAYELMFGLDWFEALKSVGDQGDLLTVLGGLNWWWLAQSTNLKIQFGVTQLEKQDWDFKAILQAQLLF
ncbi:MAG: hypothetical protein GXP49_13865 [Deltaproteobacteria bacterium]|nr:hypothetical protein [Deltaproteobacteria bacterium]